MIRMIIFTPLINNSIDLIFLYNLKLPIIMTNREVYINLMHKPLAIGIFVNPFYIANNNCNKKKNKLVLNTIDL